MKIRKYIFSGIGELFSARELFTTPLYLDLIRSMAASAVVFHHFNSIWGGSGSDRLFPDVGQEAVVAFFVLSGYIMAWITTTREKTPSIFLINRSARIYSTLIPCIVLEMTLNSLSTWIGSNNGVLLHLTATEETAQRAVLTLLFLNYSSVFGGVGFQTMPVWSLTYEVIYYTIFGLLIFVQRAIIKILMVGGLCLFVGPEPLLFFPMWALGVLLYRHGHRLRLSIWVARVLFFTSAAVLILLQASGVRYGGLMALPGMFGFTVPADVFVHTKFFLYFYLIALGVATNILTMNILLRDGSRMISSFIADLIRWFAGASFVLYLVHTSMMLFLDALLDVERVGYLIPLFAILLLTIIGGPIERTRDHYRALLSRLVLRKR